jgi:hypothetical protein
MAAPPKPPRKKRWENMEKKVWMFKMHEQPLLS